MADYKYAAVSFDQLERQASEALASLQEMANTAGLASLLPGFGSGHGARASGQNLSFVEAMNWGI